MDCEKAKRWINRLIDDALEEELLPELDRHLASCPTCSAFRNELLALRGFFKSEIAPPPSADLRDRVLRAARQEIVSGQRNRIRVFSRRLAVAALFVAALTVGLFYFGSSGPLQAVDTDKEVHYEDLFQSGGAVENPMIEALIKTDNPREAFKIFHQSRNPDE